LSKPTKDREHANYENGDLAQEPED